MPVLSVLRDIGLNMKWFSTSIQTYSLKIYVNILLAIWENLVKTYIISTGLKDQLLLLEEQNNQNWEWRKLSLSYSTYRTFAPIATAHRYCARKFARHVMHWACALKIKQTMIGKMAIATALPGFYNLGHPVTPTFLFRNRFYLQWSTHCPKMN